MDLSLQLYSRIQNVFDGKVFIHGGSASYFHILSKLNISVELKDIDFSIILEDVDLKDDEQVEDYNSKCGEQYELLRKTTEDFCLENNCSYEFKQEEGFYTEDIIFIGYIVLRKNGREYIPLNYFTGEDIEKFNIEKISYNGLSLNVLNLEKTKENERDNVRDFKVETHDLEEREKLREKLPRKIVIQNLLNMI